MLRSKIILAGGCALALSAGAARADEIVWWSPNWQAAEARVLAKQFEAENPGTTVRIEETQSDGLQNKAVIALRSGSPPDIIEITSGWNIPFALTGKLEPLDDDIKKSGLDMSDFYPVSLEAAQLNGKIYGLPYRMESHAMVFNKAMFRDAGLDPEHPPQTWPEFIDAAKKLTKMNAKGQQQYGYGIAGGGEVMNTMYRSLPFIWMNGGSFLSPDEKTAVVNTPQSVAAVAFYTDMLTKLHVAPPSTLQNDGNALRNLFTSGVIAMYQTGNYDLAPIHQANPAIEVGVMKLPHPEGKEPVSVYSGWSFTIPKDAKHKEAAWKLVAFMERPANMAAYTVSFPARKSAMADPRFQDPELKTFKDMLPYMRQLPSTAAWVQIVQAYFDNVQKVLANGATPQDAMNSANKQMQALLK